MCPPFALRGAPEKPDGFELTAAQLVSLQRRPQALSPPPVWLFRDRLPLPGRIDIRLSPLPAFLRHRKCEQDKCATMRAPWGLASRHARHSLAWRISASPSANP